MRNPKTSYWLSLAGIILYNNWLLGIFINPTATQAGATISELSINGQPSAALFRILDIVAGILILLGARAIVNHAPSGRLRLVLLAGVLILGISTLVESFLPLDCSSALDKLCQQQERLGLVSWQHNFHIAESVLSYGLMFLLPLGVYLAIRAATHYNNRLKKSSVMLMVIMIIWAVESAIRFSQAAGSYGFEQRLFVVLFSIWYVQAISQTKRLLRD